MFPSSLCRTKMTTVHSAIEALACCARSVGFLTSQRIVPGHMSRTLCATISCLYTRQELLSFRVFSSDIPSFFRRDMPCLIKPDVDSDEKDPIQSNEKVTYTLHSPRPAITPRMVPQDHFFNAYRRVAFTSGHAPSE